MKYKVAALQVETDKEPSKEENMRKALDLIDKAVKEENVKAVCFNELFLTEIPDSKTTREDLERIAEPVPGPSTDVIAKKAKEHGIYVVAGSLIEKSENGKLYNTAPFIGPDGNLVGKVSLISHPPDTLIRYLAGSGVSAGPAEFPVFDTGIGKVGIVVSWDIYNSPEIWRILNLKGAQVVFCPQCASARAGTSVHSHIRAYSALYGYYVVCANRVGWRRNVAKVGDLQYNGESLIVKGKYDLAMARTGTFRAVSNMAVATIDLEPPRDVTRLGSPQPYRQEIAEELCRLLKQKKHL